MRLAYTVFLFQELDELSEIIASEMLQLVFKKQRIESR